MSIKTVTHIKQRIQTSSVPLDYWIGYLACAVELGLITPDEYDRLNDLVEAHCSIPEAQTYKYQYCPHCHTWRLHQWLDGQWRCCNCSMRQGNELADDEPEPETGPCPFCGEVQTPLGDPCPKCDAALEEMFDRMAEGPIYDEPLYDPYDF